MSKEIIDRLNYAAVLTAEARRYGLDDYCAPVALTPFCSHPQAAFDFTDLIRNHDHQFFGVDSHIARARLSILIGLGFNPHIDAEPLADIIREPVANIHRFDPSISGQPIRGFLVVLNSPDREKGHVFSVIPSDFLPRDMRRELKRNDACLVVDINQDGLTDTIRIKDLAAYTGVYLNETSYTESSLIILTDKKVNSPLYEFD